MLSVQSDKNEEDEISNVNTDEALIPSSRQSFETIESNGDCSSEEIFKNKLKKGRLYYLLIGIISLLWGIATIIWPSFNLLMDERLRMRPGLPPYEFWKNPPDEVLIRVYIFNCTNSIQFLNDPNHQTKLHFDEIGPIVYREKLTHTNVTFNSNGTMSYKARRKAIFLPEMNHLNLNSTIIVPNWALLGIASYLHDQTFFIKLGFNLMTRTVKSTPFLSLTIDQFLWNFTDPILDAAHKTAPFLVPIKNLGILSRIYTNFENMVTVFMGTNHSHKNFFLIDKYDGSVQLPNYGPSCQDHVTGSTEGVAYPQYLTKNDTLTYWRKTLCKNAVLHYNQTVNIYGMNAYRFILPPSTFDRTEPSSADCYRSEPRLADGLSDVSKCHFGFPLASSFPHYLYANFTLNVTGLRPNRDKHESFVVVEPTTGVPLHSRARSQSNLIVRELRGFNDLVSQFSNLVIPMFWLEYNQVGLPWYIAGLVYFQVNILPIFQWFFTVFLFTLSAILVFIYWNQNKIKLQQVLLQNKILVFEKELFLKKTISK